MSWVRCTACNNHFAIDKETPMFCQYCGGRMTSQPLNELEDKFRKKHGLNGEVLLYRAANEQHKVKHPKALIDCKICMAITRGMARLVDEGREMGKKNVPMPKGS